MAQSWLFAGPRAMAVRSAHGFPLTRTKTQQRCRRPHRQGSRLDGGSRGRGWTVLTDFSVRWDMRSCTLVAPSKLSLLEAGES